MSIFTRSGSGPSTKRQKSSGVVLLDRNRRRVAPTDSGRAFAQDARALLAAGERVAERAREVEAGREGTLTFGLIGAATFEAMPLLMAQITPAAPGMRFRFREMTAREQVAALREGAIDAGLVRAEPRAAGLEVTTIMTEPVVCLMPDGHPLARQEVVAIADLEGEPILNLSRDYDPAAHDFYVGLYRKAGFEPRIVHEVSQIATILFVVATSGCVTLGPAGWRVLRREGVAIRPLAPPVATVSTRLVWNPRRVSPSLSVALSNIRQGG